MIYFYFCKRTEVTAYSHKIFFKTPEPKHDTVCPHFYSAIIICEPTEYECEMAKHYTSWNKTNISIIQTFTVRQSIPHER